MKSAVGVLIFESLNMNAPEITIARRVGGGRRPVCRQIFQIGDETVRLCIFATLR
jgi:hypothetical protein